MARSKRFPVTFQDEVEKYIDESSRKLGLSKSAFVNMCVALHKQQQEVLSVMNQMPDMLSQLNALRMEVDGNEK